MSYKGKLKCWYTNDNNLSNKLSEFRSCIDKEKPDVIGVTEVWMKEEFVLQGYHPAVRYDRTKCKKGGGVLLFVKDNLQMTEWPVLNDIAFNESVWCIIKLTHSESILLGVCYRSPTTTTENDLELNKLFKMAQASHVKHIQVMGDFNYPQIDWKTGRVSGPADSSQVSFFEMVQDLYWIQSVEFDTRFRIGCNPSQLDLIFTNREYSI